MRRFGILALAFSLLVGTSAAKGRDREAEEAWKAARTSLLSAMKTGDVAARTAAVEAVAKIGTPEAAELIVEKVFEKENSGRVLDAAVSRLARHLTPEGFDWIVTRARKGKDKWHAKSLVLEVLADRADPAPAYDTFVALMDNDDPRVLATCIYGLSRCGKPEAIDVVLPHLEAEQWQVRVAAIEALADLGGERAIIPLVRLLQTETGRLRGDVADALKTLTKKDFGIDPDLWVSWLKAKEEGREEEADSEKGGGAVASKVDVPTYYGIKIVSDRIVFVIDVSLSMNDPIEIDRKRMMRETRTLRPNAEEEESKGPRLEDTIDWWKIKTRLDLAKAQMVFALGQLERRHAFNIVFFSEYAEMWQERLVKATGRNRVKAAKYVDALGLDDKIRGGTNAWESLEVALSLGGRDPDKRYAEGIDTIFFLSDGAPSRGKHVDPDEILAEIRRLNRSRKIKIHAIAIVNFDIKFLRELAHQNGGVYKSFKGDSK